MRLFKTSKTKGLKNKRAARKRREDDELLDTILRQAYKESRAGKRFLVAACGCKNTRCPKCSPIWEDMEKRVEKMIQETLKRGQ